VEVLQEICTKKREGSGGGRSDRNSGPREGGFGGKLCSQEKEVLAEEVQLQEVKVLQTELKDVLKVC
jgi:hypothetical protein